MKLDRLIGILSVLLQREQVTAFELAEKFEVSHRTILRDMDALCCAGIPIVTEKGRNGGIRMMEGYKLDKTVLLQSEMQAILAGLQSLDSISGTHRYRQLMEKLSVSTAKTIPAEHPILIDLSAWDSGAISQKIEQIQAAMEQNHKISFSYSAPSGTTSREIEPYHLIFQWGHWYVWGYCQLRQDYRLFKLTRITDLQIEPEQRAARSVPAYTPDPMPPEEPAVPVLVRFSAAVKWRVMDDFGTEALQTEPDGSLLVSVCWQDLQALDWRLLAYGEQAEILSPPEARADFAEMLRKILKKYEEPSGGF